jgi:hypothetical protein
MLVTRFSVCDCSAGDERSIEHMSAAQPHSHTATHSTHPTIRANV